MSDFGIASIGKDAIIFKTESAWQLASQLAPLAKNPTAWATKFKADYASPPLPTLEIWFKAALTNTPAPPTTPNNLDPVAWAEQFKADYAPASPQIPVLVIWFAVAIKVGA